MTDIHELGLTDLTEEQKIKIMENLTDEQKKEKTKKVIMIVVGVLLLIGVAWYLSKKF